MTTKTPPGGILPAPHRSTCRARPGPAPGRCRCRCRWNRRSLEDRSFLAWLAFHPALTKVVGCTDVTTRAAQEGGLDSRPEFIRSLTGYVSAVKLMISYRGLGWNVGVFAALVGPCGGRESLALTGDCLQGTREGGAEPEERQAAQGEAEEAHGDVVLQPARQAQGGWPVASSGHLPSSTQGRVHGGGGWAVTLVHLPPCATHTSASGHSKPSSPS